MIRDTNQRQGLWVQNGAGDIIPVTISDIAICGTGNPELLGIISFTSGTVSTLIVSSGREVVLESNADCHVTLGASGEIGGTIPEISGIPVTASMPKSFPIIGFSGWVNVTQAAVDGSGQLWIWDNK